MGTLNVRKEGEKMKTSSDKLKVVVHSGEVWVADDGSETKGELGFFRVHGNCQDDVFPEIYARAFELLVATEEGRRMFKRYQEPYLHMSLSEIAELEAQNN